MWTLLAATLLATGGGAAPDAPAPPRPLDQERAHGVEPARPADPPVTAPLLELLALPGLDGSWRHLWRPGRPALVLVLATSDQGAAQAVELVAELREGRAASGLDALVVSFDPDADAGPDAARLATLVARPDPPLELLLGGPPGADPAQALGLRGAPPSGSALLVVDAGGALAAHHPLGPGADDEQARARLVERLANELDALCLPARRAEAELDARTRFERGPWWRPSLPGLASGAAARFELRPAGPVCRTRVGGVELDQGGRWAGRTFDAPAGTGRVASAPLRLVAAADHLLVADDLSERWWSGGGEGRPTSLFAVQALRAVELDDADLRAEGAWALGHHAAAGDEVEGAVERLLELLEDGDALVRANAAAGLRLCAAVRPGGTDGRARLERALAAAAGDANWLVRREAARALAARGLGADLSAAWRASDAPFERELARVHARAVAAGRR